MATNNLNLTAADSGKVFPLRGDMGVALNFTPPNNNFRIGFMTQDAGTFIIGSGTRMFRALNAAPQSSLSVGGKIGLFIELMYDTDKNEFVVTKNNLVAGEATGGTGGTGTAATIAVAETVTGAPGTAALVENIGTPSAVQLKFTIPAGQNGTNATGGGVAFPPGGTTAQYLGKTGNADGQVGWLTLPASTGGTGGGSFTPEVLLTQNELGEVTPDKALGNNFRVMLTRPGKFKNPIGYLPGEEINLTVRTNASGPYEMAWELDYGHNNRQIPKLATKPGGLNWIKLHLTDAIDANNAGCWKTEVWPKDSQLGYGVPAIIARNVTRNKEYYVLRSPTLPAAECGMTDMLPGETLKIVRDGLGIEAFGAVEFNGTALISGALLNLNRAELRTGSGVRAAFDRGVIALGGEVTATVQDLILSGAREFGTLPNPGSSQGISITANSKTTLRNLRIYDNENGLLSPNADFTGTLAIYDTVFTANGVGDPGYTHNIYMGRHNQAWIAERSDFTDCVTGHNVKSRAPFTLNQCLVRNSRQGREIDMPNGGQMYVNDCIVHHYGDAGQNDCIRIAAEGIEPNRPREYIIRNTHLRNDKSLANACSFVWNEDPDVDVRVIDCTFEGPEGTNYNWVGANAQGMRGRVIVEFTGGPVGPRATVGYQTIPVTPIAG